MSAQKSQTFTHVKTATKLGREKTHHIQELTPGRNVNQLVHTFSKDKLPSQKKNVCRVTTESNVLLVLFLFRCVAPDFPQEGDSSPPGRISHMQLE